MTQRLRNRLLKTRLEPWLALCENGIVQIYGPYPPSQGRTRWRLQVYDPATQRKISVTAANRDDALKLLAQLEQEVKSAKPKTVHEVLEEFLEYKRSVLSKEHFVLQLGMKLRQLIPDVTIQSITPQKAESYYLAETRRVGKYGVLKPATHHLCLRRAKEFFAWLVRRGLATSNPFSGVEPIGRVNTGKLQPRESEAKTLDALLFAKAEAGDEGALALLVQLYLGCRPSEVLALTVGCCEAEATRIYVPGTKTKNARRKLELYPPVAALVQRHCAGRPVRERLFAANLPKQPSANWMYKRLHRYCDEIQIPRICPHALRGLHSSLALAAGATTHNVAQALGHANFSTTARHYASPESVANGRAKNFAAAFHAATPSVEELLGRLPEALRAQVLAEMKR